MSLSCFTSDILTLYGHILRLNCKHQEAKKGACQVQLCSNLQYSSVILSNFCNFSQLVLSAHPLLVYQLLSSHQTFTVLSIFVVLSNFCHFLTPCYLFTFYVIYASNKCTCCTRHTHNSLFFLTVRALSAPIHLSYTHQASSAIVPF